MTEPYELLPLLELLLLPLMLEPELLGYLLPLYSELVPCDGYMLLYELGYMDPELW